nr:group 1 glycosyltransferase [Glycomyces sp. NRRL B-16210]
MVMLVQNGVVGDSRVQKEAEAAAAAGWEVFLLGRSRGGAEEWELGGAHVRLVPAKRVFEVRRHEVRRSWLRSPLAYPPGPLKSYRRTQIRARGADLETARAARAFAGRGEAGLLPRRAALALARRWVDLRVRATDRLSAKRADASGLPERAAKAFWLRVLGDRAWRRLDPALWDLELAFGPVVDELAPDLIHANDFQMLGVGARAKLRAAASGRDVKLVWDVHEFLPGMHPWKRHPWWHPAQSGHEREFAPYADAVVTVSDTMARLVKERHGLAETPAVVMNVPDAAEAETPAPGLRERCGVDAAAPLIVYSGAPLEQRGLHIMVEALPRLPEVHAAFVVSKPHWKYVRGLEERARELGVDKRVHVLSYVPHRQVVPFVAEADAGIIPLHHWGNHEISLITKFFEYSHARLPIVVSDVETMSDLVRRTGQGEVFEAEDLDGFTAAVERVLADPARYRAAYEDRVPLADWTWPSQARRLTEVYEGLVGAPRHRDAA